MQKYVNGGITKENGNFIAQYLYDEWGNLLYIDSDDRDDTAVHLTVAEANPLRYRGYYYDAETGYYYLQSRYYDSEICRFINSDIIEISVISKDLFYGNSLYTYCNNNPVNYLDTNGHSATLVGAGTFAVLIQALIEFLGYLLMGVVMTLFGAIIGSVISSITSNNTITKEKEDIDTKPKKRKSYHAEYQFCFMSNSGIKKSVGPNMTWKQTMSALGIINTSLEYTEIRSINRNNLNKNAKTCIDQNRNCWGIYAKSQQAAKTLAVALGYTGTPRYIPGGYPHYHDGKHIIHIWYGERI